MRHSSPAQRLGRTANLVILLGLGYGIRYGSSACLYVAMAICAGLSLYCGVLVVSGWTPYYMLRLALSAWACWRLYRAIPAMQLLQQEGAFPLPMSRYGELFLRRLWERSG